MPTRAIIGRTVLGALIAVAATGAARAADESAFTPPAPLLYDWSGGYAGVAAGGVWGAFDTVYGGPGGPAGFSLDGDGFTLGALAGVAAQFNNVVFGIEMDASFSTAEDTRLLAGVPVTAQNDWWASLRGRAGYAFDRVMLYGTAGLAAGDVELSAPGGSASETRVGWTVGAGVEAAITDNFTARAEYLYTDLGQASGVIGGSPFTTEFDSHTLRAGVTYRFR